MFEQHVGEDRHNLDLLAGKTAPASVMPSSHLCVNGVCHRPDSVATPGLVALMKPYSSAPNIDLLHHTEANLVARPNEAEDILQLHGVKSVDQKYSVAKQRGRSIPEIVVVCNEDESCGTVDSCVHTHEPDIVQSTKSSSLPRQIVTLPVQPVAPPRRKKAKTKSSSSANAANEVCESHLFTGFPHLLENSPGIFS